MRHRDYRHLNQILVLIVSLSFLELGHARSLFQTKGVVQCWRVQNSPQLAKTRGGSRTRRRSSSAATEGLKNSIASGLAAACSKTLLAPFDTIKTVQQQVRQEVGGKALSFVDAARIITRRPKGFFELYAGLGVSAVGAIPSVGLYFGIYSYSKRLIIPRLQRLVSDGDTFASAIPNKVILSLGVAASAAIGNTVASFSRVPYEVVKQQLQTGQYSSTWTALSSMFKAEGMRAFFPMGGVSIQMIRDIPYAIITLLAYEAIQDHWVHNALGQKGWKDMVAGAIAGGVGSYLTNPMDVVKTRLQTNPDLYGGSIIACAQSTFHEGGAAAFLRGSVPRLMHKVPANSFFFFFYEAFKRLI